MNEVNKTRFSRSEVLITKVTRFYEVGSYYESNKVLAKRGSYKRKTFWGPKKSKNFPSRIYCFCNRAVMLSRLTI